MKAAIQTCRCCYCLADSAGCDRSRSGGKMSCSPPCFSAASCSSFLAYSTTVVEAERQRQMLSSVRSFCAQTSQRKDSSQQEHVT